MNAKFLTSTLRTARARTQLGRLIAFVTRDSMKKTLFASVILTYPQRCLNCLLILSDSIFLIFAVQLHRESDSVILAQWFSTFLWERNPNETFQGLEEPLSINLTP